MEKTVKEQQPKQKDQFNKLKFKRKRKRIERGKQK